MHCEDLALHSHLYRDCVQTILCRSGQTLQRPALPIYSAACALAVHLLLPILMTV